MNDDIVIVGAGHAGVRAALAIRATGSEVPVIMIADEGCESSLLEAVAGYRSSCTTIARRTCW